MCRSTTVEVAKVKYHHDNLIRSCIVWPARILGIVLVLHTPIIKYIFERYLGIICIVGGKNGKENKEGLKQSSSVPL